MKTIITITLLMMITGCSVQPKISLVPTSSLSSLCSTPFHNLPIKMQDIETYTKFYGAECVNPINQEVSLSIDVNIDIMNYLRNF